MKVAGRILAALLASMMAAVAEQSPVYSPVRPPAIPLAVRSPYTSVWSTTTGGEVLNSLMPRHWTGDSVGWEGIVTVDGISYEYMGVAAGELPFLSSSFKGAVPQTVSYDSQHSNFTFTAGPVEITASFFSPVTPRDLCRTSVPLSYLTTSVQSTDGQPHSVVFYSDISSAWIDAHWDWEINWDLFEGAAPANKSRNATETPDDVYSWIYQRQQQTTFGEQRDFPQWGNVSYSSSPMGATSFMFQSGLATSVRLGYVNSSRLTDDVEDAVPNFGDATPVFAFAHDFGSVQNASVRYTVGSIQDPAVKYLYSGGIAQLTPWWQHCYGNLHDMIHFHWDDFETVQGLSQSFETQLRADIDSFYEGTLEPVVTNGSATRPPGQPADGTDQYGQPYDFNPDNAYGYLDPDNSTGIAIPFVSEADSYYAIVALSARQVMGAYAYAQPPPGTATAYGGGVGAGDVEEGPLVFQKEISSNGNTNTVDVLYPASPFFLYANPAMLRGALAPLVALQEGGFYPQGYCMHDVGARFPNATGHVEGDDEYMPVEESGNLVLLAYAYYKFSADTTWLAARYPLLRRFAVYLVDSALVPASQLSTDDFAGTLTNQTNLALKGIVGLQAMAGIAQVAGQTDDAAYFSAKAQDYYRQWEELAIDPSGQHTMLAYQWRSSWGLLYNVYFDKLLNMGLVSGAVYAMQSRWYAEVSQVFGVPLDSRHGQTKTDWEVWAAAGSSASTRRLLVNAVAYFLNQTTIGHPFPDLHETTGTAAYPAALEFRARPVAGAHFALLALHRSGQNAAAVEADTTGSLFVRNGSLPLPPEAPPPTPAIASRKRQLRVSRRGRDV